MNLYWAPNREDTEDRVLEYSNEHVNHEQESFAVLLNFRKKLVFNNLLLLGSKYAWSQSYRIGVEMSYQSNNPLTYRLHSCSQE